MKREKRSENQLNAPKKLVSCEIGKLYLILESLKNDQNYMKMSERNQSLFLKKNENFSYLNINLPSSTGWNGKR
jgi:hypothetical protein